MNMIPQLAQQPRPVSQQFDSHSFAGPSFQSIPNFRRGNQPASLPFRSLREFAPPPTQPHRTFPLDNHAPRRTGFARGSSSDSGFRSQYNDPSEHMLRRKTPNGTLAAGYDGTPVQWSSKAPALKHVVLPLSGSAPSRSNPYSHSPLSEQHSLSRSAWSHQKPNQYVPSVAGEPPVAVDGETWTQLPLLPNLSHGSWDHTGAQQSPQYFSNNSTQIPTVLQPTYHPSPGPTASNDGGLYGPYWPDGRFVPYRPAAFRGQGTHFPIREIYTERSPVHTPADSLISYRHPPAVPGIDFHYHSRNLSFNFEDYKFPMRDHRIETPNQPHTLHIDSSYGTSSEGSKTPTAESVKAGNQQFKEKTLSWAHTIYVDLLAYIHQSKKESKTPNHGSKHPRTSIYPKPPRQSASYLAASPWMGLNSGTTEAGTMIRQSGTMLRPQSISSSNMYNGWHSKIGEVRPRKISIGDARHYMSSLQYPPLDTVIKAKEALELLTNLCEQSGWSWIDGMLLGGCLAYGLEQYHNAIDWYSKIIALDPKHVEAMSNLAAALLCLNRREEAEHHWLQAVRLRPSYFEAVEHLIGLLCGNQRGNEAVAIIDFVERSLKIPTTQELRESSSETSSNTECESFEMVGASSEAITLDYECESSSRPRSIRDGVESLILPGFGSSGYSIPGAENGRILSLIHAKGNMLYALGDTNAASKAFEDAVLISAGRGFPGIQGLIQKIVNVLSLDGLGPLRPDSWPSSSIDGASPLLLPPDNALQTARLVFTNNGELPGLRHVPEGLARKAAVSTTSNSLLSLAKIFQDAMSSSSPPQKIAKMPAGVGDILALYYLSLSLQPSPSTANNVGILLASVQQHASHRPIVPKDGPQLPTGVVPGSGIALALAYYNYGLNLDARHAHIYTNLGSLLKDLGQLSSAISMYEKAVACDGQFDIALANLANAVKDQGRTADAIDYYRRAVAASPDFAEAVCGLANALNSVCDWAGRGGVILDGGKQDRWHVDETGMIMEARAVGSGSGWMKRVVDIVAKQLKDGSAWGRGILQGSTLPRFIQHLEVADTGDRWTQEKRANMHTTLDSWAGQRWEGARVVRLIERAGKRAMRRWYHDKHVKKKSLPPSSYIRPQIPSNLAVPTAPTVLPFHTFTCPLSAKDIRMISQRNALRISCSTLRAPWMPASVFPPPSPPTPQLNIGYVSSDFNNHPLAHLMQSVFGFHDPRRVRAFCYATTPSDHSVHRHQIEREAPVFRDASSWSAERLIQQIVQDGIHILINLNGYTRGARNEVFAARPAPIQMSFMGFAGTLGAEWCDYLLADETAIPPETLRPWRRNLDLEDQLLDQESHDADHWVYSENIIFCKETFFCCDHAQSESRENQSTWDEEQAKRWKMRKELFPSLSDDAIILGNFNQLYKIEPTTFRTWLRILDKVPKAILWLLRFPDLGESNLKRTAQEWAGASVASRIWFTDVAPKHQHISRARVCDLFLDTPECNAHTTAADILWSSTPLLTLPRYKYKMCSRMAASILKGALPRTEEGRRAAEELIAEDDAQYEEFAIRLAGGFSYNVQAAGGIEGVGRLGELRKLLFDSRWTCALFDTRRWVSDLESAYSEAWRRWVANEGGDIYL